MTLIAVRKAISSLLLATMTLYGQDFVPSQKKYAVVVTPGTPSIWSMEQAHYLLNRLRANNDSLRSTAPGASDLDPNATNGIRLEALQTMLHVSAAYNQIDALKNQENIKQFQQNSTQRTALLSQVTDLQNKLYQDQLALAQLQGQQERLTDLLAINPTAPGSTPTPENLQFSQQLADVKGQIAALTAKNTATSAQITALTTQAGSAPSLSLTATTPPDAPAPPTQILSDTSKTLMNKAADSFTQPKLAASIVLDNFLQMQYEIVAKQLTALRDEVGMGQRLVFLELPTSIASADRRIFGVGGEDKIAQSWWRVNRIFRQYKTQDSPCWEGDETYARGMDANTVPQITSVQAPPKTQPSVTNPKKGGLPAPPPPPSDFHLLTRNYSVDVQGSSDDAVVNAKTALETAYSTLIADLKKLDKLLDSPKPSSDELNNLEPTINSDLATVWSARAELNKARTKYLAKLPTVDPKEYTERENLVRDIEKTCKITREDSDLLWQDIRKTVSDITAHSPQASSPDSKLVSGMKFKILQELSRRLGELLVPQQMEIYSKLGDPLQITSAFYSKIDTDAYSHGRLNASSAENQAAHIPNDQGGLVRTVEIIPHQSAVNVNTAHSLSSAWSISMAFNLVFGFGAKGDYERQREKYDQFLQQETFASGFGKGKATFGWTFGPLPGSRILNTGVRNTYAALTVPDDTTALELEAVGCAYHRKDDPPPAYPFDLEHHHEFNCGTPLRVIVGVPDQANAGGFWVSGLRYEPVAAGGSTSVILDGRYFSPQTTILVNGRRLVQVLGVGKPLLKMDDDGGVQDPANDAAISGTYEYVNQHQITLDLTIPKTYAGPDFPVITLVAPSRALTLNGLTLSINGSSGKLADESITPKTPHDPPGMAITGWQYFGTAANQVKARLIGTKLTDIDKLSLNGVDCTITPANDVTAFITCTATDSPTWELLAIGKEDPTSKKIPSSAWSVTNPNLISIASIALVDGSVQYDNDRHPILMTVRLTGTGFSPMTQIDDPTNRMSTSYQSPTEVLCTIAKPGPFETIRLRGQQAGLPASIQVARPPDKAPDAAAATTVTKVQSEKTVVKK